MSIKEFFDSCEDSVELHDPFTVTWSEKGRGFGQYQFFIKDGKLHIENECDSKFMIKRIMCKLIDEAILEDDPWVDRKARLEAEKQENQDGGE